MSSNIQSTEDGTEYTDEDLQTCDKCGEPIHEGDQVMLVSDAVATGPYSAEGPFRQEMTVWACHDGCWDGVADTGISMAVPK